MTPSLLINKFGLLPHPEGGWYKETYRSGERLDKTMLPERFNGTRSISTAIYFLLEQGNFSAFHRIKSDECWHFYCGGSLLIYIIQDNGSMDIVSLGNNIEKGDLFQYVVPANCWFASKPANDALFSFVGCTVAPGFDFDDFEMANANDLSNKYPKYAEMIKSLCR